MGEPPPRRRRERHRRRAAGGAICLLAAALLAAPLAVAGGRGEPGPAIVVRIELPDREADLRALQRLGIDVDAVFDGWARAYLVRQELGKLRRLGFQVDLLPRPPIPPPAEPVPPGEETIPAVYHTYATLTADLQAIAADHADIVRLISIGPSVQGRELWMMKISRNPDLEEDEPELAYLSSMHGDEVVGKELCFHLIDYLTDGYGTDPRVTDLVDGAEIWILPSLNPDGTELGQRWNANGYDLNRNYPDYYDDPANTPDGRQPETQATMAWAAAHTINLAANMHGGTLVANYPFDNNPTGSSVFSPTPDPDHPMFVSISRTYADDNPPMFANDGGSFDNGVTNGAAWYAVSGGRQDWSYVWYGSFEITLELSEIKWPPASQLPGFWDDNLESMLAYLERGLEGVRGLVTDAETSAPLAAQVFLGSSGFPTPTDPDLGDYHRPVLPGQHTMQVSAPGYQTQVLPVTVVAGPAVRQDVALVPLPTDLQPVSALVDDGPGGDGWLDPDEAADLSVTIVNLGRSATGVGARLEPTGWYAEVLRADAGFPDVGTGGTVVSDAPHFQVRPAAGVPPGHKLGFALRWGAEQGAGISEPFFLGVGAPSCEAATALDVPQPIVDYGTAKSRLAFGPQLEVGEARVTVDVTHTYIGDLMIRLISPAGTPVVLHDRTGGSTDDLAGTYGVDLTPSQPLSLLDGEPSAGTWTLEVADKAGGDTGSLNSWSLDLCGGAVEAATPEMRLRDVTPVPGGVRLTWWEYPGLDSYRVYRSTDPTSAAAFVDVTGEDDDDTDTSFLDASPGPLLYFLVTGVGPQGAGPLGHFGG